MWEREADRDCRKTRVRRDMERYENRHPYIPDDEDPGEVKPSIYADLRHVFCTKYTNLYQILYHLEKEICRFMCSFIKGALIGLPVPFQGW